MKVYVVYMDEIYSGGAERIVLVLSCLVWLARELMCSWGLYLCIFN